MSGDSDDLVCIDDTQVVVNWLAILVKYWEMFTSRPIFKLVQIESQAPHLPLCHLLQICCGFGASMVKGC